MDIVKAFNTNTLHTEIIIKGTYDNPLFRASDIGNILDISTIRSVTRDFDETEKVVHSMHTPGGLQQVTFLTEKGLYKILFRSRKPIAETFQNWICEVIKELRINGVYDLQKELENNKKQLLQLEDTKNQELDEKLAKQKVLEKERFLLKEYSCCGPIVYIIKVKTYENGKYVVKIGHSSKGIQSRYIEHKKKYEECLLLDCFSVDKSKDFEHFIHNHDIIRSNKINNLCGHETENELFLIGNTLTYQFILNLIESNITNYNFNIREVLKENELLKLQLQLQSRQDNNTNPNNEQIQELVNTNKQLFSKIDILEVSIKEILDKMNATNSLAKTRSGFNAPLQTLGPRLQQIHPETLQLIKVYETVSEAMKEYSSIKRPSINKAVVENTIYRGYRWVLVDRELDPNVIHNILPTKPIKQQNIGYIAQINSEKTEIMNVYLDKKTACQLNDYPNSSSLDTPVKKFTLTKGVYYKLYDECSSDLKKEFIKKNNGCSPILYKNGIGQYDSTNNLIKEFICKYDCIKQLEISDKTLEKALDKNIMYKNCYFKTIRSRVKCW